MPHIIAVKNQQPKIHSSVWVAPTATVVGQVVNIQDGAIIHGTFEKSQTILEEDVSIGHNAVVHGALVKRGALIGMGSIVMDNAVIGEEAVVAAGAVVLAGAVIGDGEMWAGVPAKCCGLVSDDLKSHLQLTSARYVEYSRWFQDNGAPGQ